MKGKGKKGLSRNPNVLGSTEALDLIGPSTPTVRRPPKPIDQSKNMFIHVLGSFVIARTALILTTQSKTFKLLTLVNFMTIYIPLFSTVEIFMQDLGPHIFPALELFLYGFKVVILFALGWTVPATFASLSNTQSVYFTLTALARVYQVVLEFKPVNGQLSGLKVAGTALCQISTTLWMVAILMTDSRLYSILTITGSFSDIILQMLNRMLQNSMSNDRDLIKSKLSAAMIFVIAKLLLNDIYQTSASSGFDYTKFIYQSLGLLLNFVMFLMYSEMISIVGENTLIQIRMFDLMFQFIQILAIGSFLVFVGSLEILMTETFDPLMYIPSLPMDMTIPLQELKSGVVLNFGLDYLSTLGKAKVVSAPPTYIPIMFVAIGIYFLTLSIPSITAKFISEVKPKRFYLITTPTMALVGITMAFVPSDWITDNARLIFIVLAALVVLAHVTKSIWK